MQKLIKNKYPDGHRAQDFKCFGPPATKDGQFENTKLADLGCFTQDGKDSNKWYHAAIVKSNITGDWYTYFEYGRTGSSGTPSFQFHKGTESECINLYCKQLHAKNDKRGVWIDDKVLGKRLSAKPGKDCYLVRNYATRNTGLPDAKTITTSAPKVTNKAKVDFDAQCSKLISDLNIGTVSYTRSSLINNAIPGLDAINEGRLICSEAQKYINQHQNVDDQVNSKQLEDLTNLLYSRIPKYKKRSKDRATWVLNQNNIQEWLDDLDTFESALKNVDFGESVLDIPFGLCYHSLDSKIGQFLSQWIKSATRNKHSYIGSITIQNIYEVKKDDLFRDFTNIANKTNKGNERPLHQPDRIDLDDELRSLYDKSNTNLLFHGTRSVNVSGILREHLRLPRTLSNVATNGSLYGSGIYLADDWKKSAGYTSISNSYWARGLGGIASRGAFMFIADAILGKPYMIPRQQAFTGHPDGYHSLYAKAGYQGITVANNEFIIFEPKQIYLRYLVEFTV